MNAAAYAVLFICVAVAILGAAKYRYLARARDSRLALTGDEQYRALADEYRRLSDMAITANEHVDLRLTDLGVRIDDLRDQLDQMRRILKEVE